MRLTAKMFQARLVAAQTLADAVRSTGQRLAINSDGSVALFHGTSRENRAAILASGTLNGPAWLSASEAATMPHAMPKHGTNTAILRVDVDPQHVEFSTGTGEFYAPDGLVRGNDDVWRDGKERSPCK